MRKLTEGKEKLEAIKEVRKEEKKEGWKGRKDKIGITVLQKRKEGR